MKTLTLDQLVEKPAVAKKLAAKWGCVQITDKKGKPIWVLTPMTSDVEKPMPDEAWWNEYFAELLAEPRRKGKSAARMVIEDRGRY